MVVKLSEYFETLSDSDKIINEGVTFWYIESMDCLVAVDIPDEVTTIEFPEQIYSLSTEIIKKIAWFSSVRTFIFPSLFSYLDTSYYLDLDYLTLDFSKVIELHNNKDTNASPNTEFFINKKIGKLIINEGLNHRMCRDCTIKELVIKPVTDRSDFKRLFFNFTNNTISKCIVEDGVTQFRFTENRIYSLHLPYSVTDIYGWHNPHIKGKEAYKAMDILRNGILSCRGTLINKEGWQEEIGELVMCKSGYHYCYSLTDTLKYYPYDKNSVAITIIEPALKIDISEISEKGITNNYRIKKILTHEEIIDILNEENK